MDSFDIGYFDIVFNLEINSCGYCKYYATVFFEERTISRALRIS